LTFKQQFALSHLVRFHFSLHFFVLSQTQYRDLGELIKQATSEGVRVVTNYRNDVKTKGSGGLKFSVGKLRRYLQEVTGMRIGASGKHSFRSVII